MKALVFGLLTVLMITSWVKAADLAIPGKTAIGAKVFVAKKKTHR